MYDFIKPGEVGVNLTSLKTIFNGKTIEDEIPGFITLSVKGRGLIGCSIESKKIPGADGKFLVSSTLEPREIVVKYLLQNNNSNFRENFNKLNLLLQSKKEHILKFSDELDYYFKAILKGADEIDETSNTIVSTFTFICHDPYKYQVVKSDNGVDNVTITKLPNNPNKVIPKLIKFKVANNTDKIIIKNETRVQKIVLNNNFAVNDFIEIDLSADYILKLNYVNRTSIVDFMQTNYDFNVKQGDVISVTNGKDLEIHTEERMY
mgnify:FL=1|jgi:predicted phage tail component-like protein